MLYFLQVNFEMIGVWSALNKMRKTVHAELFIGRDDEHMFLIWARRKAKIYNFSKSLVLDNHSQYISAKKWAYVSKYKETSWLDMEMKLLGSEFHDCCSLVLFWGWVSNIFCRFSHQQKEAADPCRWVLLGWHGCHHYFISHFRWDEFHKEIIRYLQSCHIWMWSGSLIYFREVWSVMGEGVDCHLNGKEIWAQSGEGVWPLWCLASFSARIALFQSNYGQFILFLAHLFFF